MLLASFVTTLAPVGIITAAVSVIVALVGAIWGVKWKSAAESSAATNAMLEKLAAAAEDYGRLMKEERDELRVKLDEVTVALGKAEKTIARLEALPNLQAVLELLSRTYERIEEKEQERHAILVSGQDAILAEIAALRRVA